MAVHHLVMAALVAASYLHGQFKDNKLALEQHMDEQVWQDYKLAHEKSYESIQNELLRKWIFFAKLHKIQLLNETADGYVLDVNKFTDWTDEELKVLRGYKMPAEGLVSRYSSEQSRKFLEDLLNDPTPVPEQVDWRQVAGRVSQVKDQGQCGSCWAFASVGALEGQEARHMNKSSAAAAGKVEMLSEQQLVSCDDSNHGCYGGIMLEAFRYVAEAGIESEQAYPYAEKTGEYNLCHYNKTSTVMSDTGYAMLPTGDELELKKAVAKFGPVSVAIDASSDEFHAYKKGVFSVKGCSEDFLDHAVLVVGYGKDEATGLDYWLVKNSWGAGWGDHGYIKMIRNKKNHCGIASTPTIPTF